MLIRGAPFSAPHRTFIENSGANCFDECVTHQQSVLRFLVADGLLASATIALIPMAPIHAVECPGLSSVLWTRPQQKYQRHRKCGYEAQQHIDVQESDYTRLRNNQFVQ